MQSISGIVSHIPWGCLCFSMMPHLVSARLSALSGFLAITMLLGLVSDVGAQNTVRTIDIVRTFDFAQGHRGEVGCILEANSSLFTGAQDSVIKIWNIQTGRLIQDVRGHTGWVRAFATVDNWLFSGGDDGMVKQWTMSAFTLTQVRSIYAGGSVTCIAAQNRAIYVCVNNPNRNAIIQYNVDTGTETRRFLGHTADIRGIIIHNNLMFSASEDSTVRRWDLTILNPVPVTLTGSIQAMAIEKTTDRFFVSGSGVGGAARVNEYELDGTFHRQLSHNIMMDTLSSVKVENNLMLTSGNEGLKVWNLTSGLVIRDLLNLHVFIVGAGKGSFYSVSNDGGSIRRWNWTDFSIMWTVPPNYGWSASVSNGVSLWAGRDNGEIWQYDVVTGQLVRILTGHTSSITEILISGNNLFSSSEDSTAKQWSLVTGSLIRTFSGHSQGISGMGISGNMLITGGFYDMTLRIWNLNNGALVRTIANISSVGRIYGVAATANFVVAHIGENDINLADNVAHIYDWTNGSFYGTFSAQGAQGQVTQIFMREMTNGEVFLFVTDSMITGTVRVYDVRTRKLRRTFFMPGALCSLWVDASGYLFGGNCNNVAGIIWQWDITTGNLMRSFTAATGGTCTNVASNRMWIVETSTGGSLTLRTTYSAMACHRMSSFGSSLFVSDADGALRQYYIPELAITPPTTSTTNNGADHVIETATPASPGSTSVIKNEGRTNAISLLNNSVIIPVAVSGVVIGAVLVLTAFRARNNKKYTASSTMMNQLPTITSITALNGNSADLNATVNQTAVTQTFEVSIPVFLEMRWGLDFRQDDFITKGGGGSIYRATCLKSELAERSKNQPLAVKNIAEALETMQDRTRTAFFQEISLMHRFRDHPNFIRLFAYSTRHVTMVTKFYELGDMCDFISGLGPTVKRGIPYSKLIMVSLLRQFTAAIAHMHKSGIVHCDVKPANVLLDIDSNGGLAAILTDFGISRIVDMSAMKVQAFNVADLRGASIAYASPESLIRFRKRLPETDGKVWMAADIFSLAISALQMMTRIAPWKELV